MDNTVKIPDMQKVKSATDLVDTVGLNGGVDELSDKLAFQVLYKCQA